MEKLDGQYSPELTALIEWARTYVPTEAEQEEHRRSFAYGNVALHNPSITRAMVDRVADDMAKERQRG
jgi:ribosomal protein L16 Arg81 hydroxylase